MDLYKAGQIISTYEQSYYSYLRKYVADYPTIPEAFPKSLYGPRKVEIVLCKDGGGIVAHYPSETDSDIFTVTTSDLSTQELSERYGFHITLPHGTKFTDLHRIITEDHLASTPHRQYISERFCLEVWGNMKTAKWDEAHAQTRALQQINTYVSAHLLNPNNRTQLPLAQTEVCQKLDKTIKEFIKILDRNPPEETIQRFLTANMVLLSPSAANIYPKFKLGNEHITDYVIEKGDQDYVFVEIEAAKHKLVTKNANLAGAVTHAIGQIEDWLDWVDKNFLQLEQKLPGLNDPKGLVIIGRQNSMTAKDFKVFKRRKKTYSRIDIITYDDLLAEAQHHLRNLREKLI